MGYNSEYYKSDLIMSFHLIIFHNQVQKLSRLIENYTPLHFSDKYLFALRPSQHFKPTCERFALKPGQRFNVV